MPFKAPPVFVFLGRGGAGKTESAPLVSKLTGLPVVELGNFIRKQAVDGNTIAKYVVDNFIKKGKYFPGSHSTLFLQMAINENPRRFENGFIIDGFPRRTEDLKLFEQTIRENGFRVGGLIELKIPQQVSMRRQPQRKRETPAAIQNREKEFLSREQKVIAAFRKLGLVQTIDMRVGGRKARIPEFKKTFELSNPKFLRQKSRVIAKALKRLKTKRPILHP